MFRSGKVSSGSVRQVWRGPVRYAGWRRVRQVWNVVVRLGSEGYGVVKQGRYGLSRYG